MTRTPTPPSVVTTTYGYSGALLDSLGWSGTPSAFLKATLMPALRFALGMTPHLDETKLFSSWRTD